jgi:hypothetical protein
MVMMLTGINLEHLDITQTWIDNKYVIGGENNINIYLIVVFKWFGKIWQLLLSDKPEEIWKGFRLDWC